MQLKVLNLSEARFECTFGRGCEGICCRNGRPPVYEDEAARIAAHLPTIIPMLRTNAARLVSKLGFLSGRRKAGQRMLRVVDGWCVFFNEGCVLHKLGARAGNPLGLKPFLCAVFPLDKHSTKGWYVRQKGVLGEIWDLPCLDPAATNVAASESLKAELRLLTSLTAGRSER